MTLLDDINKFFGTKVLYEVLNLKEDATASQIKKAYRKTSLKVHPDRVPEQEKDKATKKFQALAQVHYILSDPEKRKLYDEQGIIANEDGLEGEADWSDYWRLLFPKVSESDIQTYLDKYVGSEEEEKDLIAIYNRFEGDMDKISETHIAYHEEKTTEHLKRLIDSGVVNSFPSFAEESAEKKSKRLKKAEREARKADKLKKEMTDDDKSMSELTALIKGRSQANFDSMISNLEAKYGRGKGVKRKKGKQ